MVDVAGYKSGARRDSHFTGKWELLSAAGVIGKVNKSFGLNILSICVIFNMYRIFTVMERLR